MQIVSICSNQIEIYRKVEEDQRADDDIRARRCTQKYNNSNKSDWWTVNDGNSEYNNYKQQFNGKWPHLKAWYLLLR